MEEIKLNILVSACLLGINCRYDGDSKFIDQLKILKDKHHLIPICPEIYGGMKTPREQSEKRNGKIISKTGEDVTQCFQRGAEETLKMGKFFDCQLAILKERSPSCGYGKIYDGTFSGTLIDGNGVTADLLAKNGIKIIGESQLIREGHLD